jgi:hypothetical protein
MAEPIHYPVHNPSRWAGIHGDDCQTCKTYREQEHARALAAAERAVLDACLKEYEAHRRWRDDRTAENDIEQQRARQHREAVVSDLWSARAALSRETTGGGE